MFYCKIHWSTKLFRIECSLINLQIPSKYLSLSLKLLEKKVNFQHELASESLPEICIKQKILKNPAYGVPDQTRKKKSVHGEWIQFKEKKLATVNCQNEEQLYMIEFIFACKILSHLNKYLNKECYPQGLRVYGCSQNYMEFI